MRRLPLGAVLLTCLGSLGCSFRAGAAGDAATGGSDSGSAVDAGGSAVDARPQDAPLGIDAAPGSCLARWHGSTPPSFGAPFSLQISHDGDVDRDPALSHDELTLYFSSNHGSSSSTTNYWRAVRASPSAAFTAGSETLAPELNANVNSSNSEDKMTISADGLDVFFSSNRNSVNQLWHTHRASTAVEFGAPDQADLAAVNQAGNLADPQLAGDDLHLYYVTDDGTGKQHIVMAARASTSAAFGPPVAFASLDSGAGDADPGVSVDEQVIVFSSQRSGGVGGTDIYYALRNSASGEFGQVRPLPDLNTADNEGDPQLSRDGCTILFATDRNGSQTFDYDLWAATMVLP